MKYHVEVNAHGFTFIMSKRGAYVIDFEGTVEEFTKLNELKAFKMDVHL